MIITLRRIVSSTKFWRNGLKLAFENVNEEVLERYRLPSLYAGWESCILKFCWSRFTEENDDFENLVEASLKYDVRIVHGKGDRIVKIENSRRLKEVCEERGGRVEVVEVEGGHCWHEESEGVVEYFK
ncbi:hypothetical protein TL16_g11043 [Triparma laevis f. inornata]|uniref:Uncharacterized protein n=1 Tax=Triparma laevis f. inornata TaxID=1714386 RepID=A0A9W7EQP5_9STRA|nr:hypothetical protein TL16_g11043 [Triparma laevis f. inornata]